MKQKTCAEILAEIGEKIDKSPVLKAACIYSDSVKKPATIYGYGKVGLIEAFKSGAEWQEKQSQWISVKDEFPPYNKEVLLFNNRNKIIGWQIFNDGYDIKTYCDWYCISYWMLANFPE